MKIEVEMRARFDEAASAALRERLGAEAEDLGPDDKQIQFYVLPDKLIKIVDNLSRHDAKIVMKTARIGHGPAFPEIEIPIAQADVPKAVHLLDAIGLAASRHAAFTRRHNYRFRGVEVALKWSETWGHHAEFEVLLDDRHDDAEVAAADGRIRAVADELGVELMTEAELLEFTRRFEESLKGT